MNEGGIVFATGGSTRDSRYIRHKWSTYEFSCKSASESFKVIKKEKKIDTIVNCLAAGNLWGGFLFGQEVARISDTNILPCGADIDFNDLDNYIKEFNVDCLLCLPSFAIRLFNTEGLKSLGKIKNIIFLGENFEASEKECILKLYPNISIIPLAYTTQETGPLGWTCTHLPEGQFHLYPHVNLSGDNFKSEYFEAIFDIEYPNYKLEGHKTSDKIRVVNSKQCQCGQKGLTIELIGRMELSTNVLGTSISFDEFKEYLNINEQDQKLSPKDLQIVTSITSSKSKVLILIDQKFESKTAFNNLLNSPLVRELQKDADNFEIKFINQSEFHLNAKTKKQNFHIKL